VLNGTGNDEDEALAVYCGSGGSVFAAGKTMGNGTQEDFTVTCNALAAVEEPASNGSGLFSAGLREVCPNPFRRNTSVAYAVSHDCPVRLRIFSPAGIIIRTLQESVVLRDCTTPPGMVPMTGGFMLPRECTSVGWRPRARYE